MNIPEDVVSYSVFLEPDQEDLLKKREEFMTLLYPHLQNYIWQNDSFVLQFNNNINCLSGRVNVGECIEDEWFITFLLLKLSEMDSEVFIQIHDDDGEFLLIEAAEYLPNWLEPELADNRVWLHNGKIHIIPLSLPGESLPDNGSNLSTNVAIQCIRKYPQKTIANRKIQTAINNRLSCFPSQIQDHQHRANVIVPYRVACILLADQQTTSVATASFYHRDNVDMKHCRAMKHFSAVDFVKISVTFTRCLYAQITKQQFHPDFKSGWPRLSPTDPDYKALQLGIKLTCGLEIAMTKSQSHQPHAANSHTPEWKLFLQRLNKFHYFQNELEGSKLHNQLMNKAKQYFNDYIVQNKNEESNKYDRIATLYNTEATVTLKELKQKEKSLPKDDDEEWLTITPDQLDSFLTDQFQLNSSSKKDSTIPDKMNKFASALSSYEGVSLSEKRLSADCEESEGQEFFSFIQSLTENLDVDPLAEESSSDGDELNDYASDSSSLSDEEDIPNRVKGLSNEDELSQLTQDKRSRQIRQEMRQMKDYMKEMDRQLKNTDARHENMAGSTATADNQFGANNSSLDAASSRITRPKVGASLAVTEDLDSDDSLGDDLDDCGVPSRQEVAASLDKGLSLSFAAQQGRPGPSGTLLQSIGVDMHERTSHLKNLKK